MGEIWDQMQKKKVEMPEEMLDFLKDIKDVCQKHGLSISHEDYHGSFMIEEYDEHNLHWLYKARKHF